MVKTEYDKNTKRLTKRADKLSDGYIGAQQQQKSYDKQRRKMYVVYLVVLDKRWLPCLSHIHALATELPTEYEVLPTGTCHVTFPNLAAPDDTAH